MTIKTWQVRAAENSIMGETRDVRVAMQAEIDELRAALANAEPEEVYPMETHCPHGAPIEDYCKLCDMEMSEQFKDTL